MQMLDTKALLSQMKNFFDVLICRLNTTEERMSELENRLIDIIQTDTRQEKRVGHKAEKE